jgi:hypothetical protein
MRSDNGIDFSLVASMPAQTTQDVYSYTDIKVPSAKLYYRIDAQQVSGDVIQSPVKTVNFSGISAKIYPNPVTENGTFTIQVAAPGLKSVNIYNSAGRLCSQLRFSDASKTISTLSWAKGVYFINIATGSGSTTTQKIFVE